MARVRKKEENPSYSDTSISLFYMFFATSPHVLFLSYLFMTISASYDTPPFYCYPVWWAPVDVAGKNKTTLTYHDDMFINRTIYSDNPSNMTFAHSFDIPQFNKLGNNDSRYFTYNIVSIYRCYVNYFGQLLTSDMQQLPGNVYWERRNLLEFPVLKQHYTHIVALGYGECDKILGHTMIDICQPLVFMLIYLPKYYTQNAYFVCEGVKGVMPEFWSLFGIPNDRIVHVPLNRYVTCDICTTICYPLQFLNSYGIHTKRLKDFFFEKYNLAKIKPERYIFSNRNNRTSRHIANLNEIVNAAKSNFPEINWEVISDIYGISEMAPVFASMKMFYTPTGSNAFKMYFMQDYSILVIPTAQCGDPWLGCLCSNCNVFHIQWKGFPSGQHDYRHHNISVTRSMEMIGRALKILETRRIDLY